MIIRFLHVRGGVSKTQFSLFDSKMFSPRAWRCFLLYTKIRDAGGVFSTCVEVFPVFRLGSFPCVSFLHVRGGVSSQKKKSNMTT